MAKIQRRPKVKDSSQPLTWARFDSFAQNVNSLSNIKTLILAFLLLLLFLTIPVLVTATINQRSIISLAKTNCQPSSSTSDQNLPSISIENPTEGQYLTENSFLIKIKASDNICVKKVELLVNGQLVKTFSGTPYIYSWDLRAVKAGGHVISARAADQAGNVSVASVSVFRSAKDLVKH